MSESGGAPAEAESGLGEQYSAIIMRLAENSHGSAELPNFKKFIKESFTHEQRREFLATRLTAPPISWEAKKDIWKEEKERKANKFPFLQGDVISTTMVLALGSAESTQNHQLWMVLSADCDCVRANYVRVAKVFAVAKDDASSKHSQKLDLAHMFASPKYFPLPASIVPNSSDLKGHFADFDVPYYIRRDDAKLATPIASLHLEAWHLFNAVLHDGATRANLDEARALRS